MKSEPRGDLVALKRRGIMEQKQPGHFTLRLRVVGGRFETVDLMALAEILTRYNLAHVHLTTRQAVEVPNVRFEDIDRMCSDLAAVRLERATLGPCVRTITACQGGTCRRGLFDTQRLAQRIDKEVSVREGLPHKFKIGITGCPNACIKPRENDLGIMGVMGKAFHKELCNGCGLCAGNCPAFGALHVDENRLMYREEACVCCGRCAEMCPTGAWRETGVRYTVFMGGRMGKYPKLGEKLPLDIMDQDRLSGVVDKTIEWYTAHGVPNERFGSTLDRIGLSNLMDYISSVAFE